MCLHCREQRGGEEIRACGMESDCVESHGSSEGLASTPRDMGSHRRVLSRGLTRSDLRLSETFDFCVQYTEGDKDRSRETG